ncbi:MAG: hypothetical protein NTV36_03615 [Candidatus Staskawiczbacteria bacterium]|nr:hypothetical protein [Candidatus Staskawiczbacteria bacterium]
MNPEPPDQQSFRDEYKLVFEGYKFFVSIRFIVAAFAMSIQSALLTMYNQTMREKLHTEFAIFGAAMLFLAATLIVEWRTTFLFRVFLRRGIELEFQLGLPNGFFHRIAEISAHKGFRRFVTHTWGINLVYVGVFSLWTMLLVATVINR